MICVGDTTAIMFSTSLCDTLYPISRHTRLRSDIDVSLVVAIEELPPNLERIELSLHVGGGEERPSAPAAAVRWCARIPISSEP